MKFFDVESKMRLGKDYATRNNAIFAWRVWSDLGREYYKVYPAVLGAIAKLRLDMNLEDYTTWDQSQFAVRFSEKSPPVVSDVDGTTFACEFVLSSMNVSNSPPHLPLLITVSKWSRVDNPSIAISGSRTYTEGPLDYDRTNKEDGKGEAGLASDFLATEMCKLELRASIFPRLLRGDPTLIEPDVLSKDADKWDRATEAERAAMVERAKRKGKVGWSIGRDYETMPHFRRPHFALRHTGKGGAIPKIVPVVGSVVHREVLTRVPTGHYDEQGREVEPK